MVVSEPDYNISTKVASVLTTTQFTYLLPFVRPNLQATPTSVASATKPNSQLKLIQLQVHLHIFSTYHYVQYLV